MIMGTGIDVMLIGRMEKSMEKDAFLHKVFTENELAYINGKGQKAQTAAGIFCAKEAFLKACGKGIGDIPLRQIEVGHTAQGAPHIVFEGAGKAHVSISHMGDIAVAQVILESEE